MSEKGYFYHFDRLFLRSSKKRVIVGIDEVGRGSLAGSVVCGAVILDYEKEEIEVQDSKVLGVREREEMSKKIRECCVDMGIGVVDEKWIDEHNIWEATKEGMRLALSKLKLVPDLILIDGVWKDEEYFGLGSEEKGVIGGDGKSACIAAASIVAKVYRDRLMSDFDGVYPGYGFKRNKGYGTKEHLRGIREHGVCEIHRRSFKPIKKEYGGIVDGPENDIGAG